MAWQDITDKLKYGLLTYVATQTTYHIANSISLAPYKRPSIVNSLADAGEQVAVMLTIGAAANNVFSRGIEDECSDECAKIMITAGIFPAIAQAYQSGDISYAAITTTAAFVTSFCISEHIDLRRNRREGKTLL